jgi:hypothetical protein
MWRVPCLKWAVVMRGTILSLKKGFDMTATTEKKPAKRPTSKSAKASAYEHIRVVPLHHPKPVLSIDKLGRLREEKDSDLFAGKPTIAPASAHLTYSGGPLITNVAVYLVFWGKLWGTTPTSTTLMTQLNDFFTKILVSPLIDQLSEYNVPGKTIGHGSLTGSKTITANAPVGSVTDSAVQAQLKAWLAAGTVPTATANSLYFIYLDPGIVSIMGGGSSCKSYCGYHNNTGKVYYAVMPFPGCTGCLGGLGTLDALTGTSSHELCEAITDPVPGSGWYDKVNGEIGDICAWSFKKLVGYNVQLEWSNKNNKCI